MRVDVFILLKQVQKFKNIFMNEKSSDPLVTICMLTWNRAKFITQAIDSVIAQTYKSWELVIIDDGSTDETRDIVASYQDPRIRYIHHTENKGLLARRKESLSEVRGKYMAILDSDDYWIAPEKLALQVAYMEKHEDCAIIGTDIVIVDVDGIEIKRRAFLKTDEHIRNQILLSNQFANSSILVRASLIAKTNGYDFAPSEDLCLSTQLGLHGTFANLEGYYTGYRSHLGGESAARKRVAKAVHKIIRIHKKNYPNFWFAWLKSWVRQLRALFP
jgi:glycosyltransferase involved in cell wall biosynthesis